MKSEVVKIKGKLKPGYLLVEPIPMEKQEKEKTTLIIPDELKQRNKEEYFKEHPNQAKVILSSDVDWIEDGDRVALSVAFVLFISQKNNQNVERFIHDGKGYLIAPKHDVIFNYGKD